VRPASGIGSARERPERIAIRSAINRFVRINRGLGFSAAREPRDYTPNRSGSHVSPSSSGGAMYPANADAATTEGLAR
jgi:hypothetical protein